MPRIVLPLGPITSPILSGLICMVMMRGAYWRHLGARARQRLVHLAEDVEPAFLRLLERLLHDLEIEALDLDVHLDRGDARARCRPP